MPSAVPSSVPRAMGPAARFRSSRPGRSRPIGTFSRSRVSGASRFFSTSANPITPIASTAKSMPLVKAETPKVRRSAPVSRSVPMVDRSNPSMMSAPTGSTLKVIGRSMVIVAMGPMPGSTPMSVPTRQPMKARPTLCSVSAVENPRARFARRSVIGSASEDQDPGDDQDGDGQIEHVPEEADRQRGHHDREDEQLLRAGFRRRGAADHRHQGPGDGEPHGPDAEREGRDREEHEEGATQRPAAERLAVLEQRTDHQPEAQDAEERGDAAGEQAWADRIEAAGPEIRGRPEGNRRDREQSQSRDEILRGADDAPALGGTCRNGFRFAGHSSSRTLRPGDTAPGRAPQIGLKSG